jgi:sugar/nucleoside kinase (ribokinase family)
MAHFDILGIGNAIVDILAPCDDRFLVENGLIKGSMRLIDAETARALYTRLGTTTVVSGGSAANTIVGTAGFSLKTAFIGKTAPDPLGRQFAHDIRAQGVLFDTLPLSGAQTASSLIVITPDGERTMNTYLGACQNLTRADIDPVIVAGSAVTYIEGYLWDQPAAKEACRLAMAVAQASERCVAFTLSDSFCVDRARTEFLELIRGGSIDLVFANQHEVKSLYETADLPTALNALANDARNAVVTLGEQGAVVLTKDGVENVPAQPIDRLVDTTGAGDLFAAGFLSGWVRGHTPRACAQLGVAAASVIIQQLGARPQRPLRDLMAA